MKKTVKNNSTTLPDVNMFPEKDLIDMSFLKLLKMTNGKQIESKSDLDKALGEIDAILNKRKELDKKYDNLASDLFGKTSVLKVRMGEELDKLHNKVTEYYNTHEKKIAFKTKENGVQEAIIKLEHGTVRITKTTTTKIKIEPAQPESKKHKAHAQA